MAYIIYSCNVLHCSRTVININSHLVLPVKLEFVMCHLDPESTRSILAVWIVIPIIITIGCSSIIFTVTILYYYKNNKKRSATSDPIYEIPKGMGPPHHIQMTKSEAYGVTTQEPFAMTECNAYKL